MAAAHDEPPTGSEAAGDRGPEPEARADGPVNPVKQNIDRVADKVKNLLRPER